MRKISVQGFESWRYVQVYKVTEWKDGCIYKTRPIGFMKAGLRDMLPEGYVTSSVPTHLSIQPQFEIDCLTKEEVESL